MKVLIIDDDRDHLDSISEALVLNGIKTKEFQSPIEAIKAYKSSKYDAVITDIKMREMDGIEVLKQLLVSNPNACVIVMTGYPKVGDAVAAVNKGAYAFFYKPLDYEDMLAVLNRIKKEIVMSKKFGLKEKNNKPDELPNTNSHEINSLGVANNPQLKLGSV